MSQETNNIRHRIILDERERLSVTGVTDVIAFDEETITADTDMGVITIRGENLHISKLNLEDGILQTEIWLQKEDFYLDEYLNKGIER